MSKRFEFVSSQLAQAQRETASHIFCVKDDGTQASFYSILLFTLTEVKSNDIVFYVSIQSFIHSFKEHVTAIERLIIVTKIA